MFELKTRHFLTGEELSRVELERLLEMALSLKETRTRLPRARPLEGQTLALVFEKPSLRTRFSFTIAMQELGGSTVESLASTSKREEPEDVARVLQGYVNGVMLRTHEHSVLERMAAVSRIPVINGLSDSHHPCQALADLLTLRETCGERPRLAYLGDGNNVLHSLLLILPFAGVDVAYACPKGHGPDPGIVARARLRANEGGGAIRAAENPAEAVRGAHALYTDVWTSMGQEAEEERRREAFIGYQLDEGLHALATPGARVMHCLPMVRDQEISGKLADSPSSVVFQQSENRLHVQKALLLGLMAPGP